MQLHSCITATAPISTVSDRYGFIPSSEVINRFQQEGWLLTKAEAVKVRKPSKEGFQRHLLRFVHHTQAQVNTGHRMETVFINSHDKTSGVVMASGVFRFVCSNGLVVSDSAINGFKMYHTGLTMDRVMDNAYTILGQQEKVAQTIDLWKSIKIELPEALKLAKTGLELRWGKNQDLYPVSAESLLNARRSEDFENTLWNIFNRVQENVINGGQFDKSRSRHDGRPFRMTRSVKSISENHNINSQLWQAASDLALAF